MTGYSAELRKDIRTKLKNPLDVLLLAIIIEMLCFSIIIILSVVVDFFLLSADYISLQFTLSIPASIICALLIRRLIDYSSIKKLMDDEQRSLLNDLSSAQFYDSPNLLLTTNYLIGLQIGIAIIPYDEILWIYKKATYSNGAPSKSELVTRLTSGKEIRFGGSIFFSSKLDSKIDEIIQELYRRNPRIILGYDFEKQTLYKSEVSIIRKEGKGSSILSSNPMAHPPEMNSSMDSSVSNNASESSQATPTISFLPQGAVGFVQCRHCQRNNPMGASFCTFCNQPLIEQAEQAREDVKKPSLDKQLYDTENSDFSYKKLKIVIVGTVVLLFLFGSLLFVLVNAFQKPVVQPAPIPCTVTIEKTLYRDSHNIFDVAKEAEGVFCILEVKITNNDVQPMMIDAEQFLLEVGDDDYKAIAYLSELMTTSGAYRHAVPSGDSTTVICIFDIPDSLKHTKDISLSYESIEE